MGVLDKVETAQLSEDLQAALVAIEDIPGFSLSGEWFQNDDVFVTHCKVTLAKGSEFVDPETHWVIFTTKKYPDGVVTIRRAPEGGIRGDFAHELPGRVPCIITRAQSLGQWDGDPQPRDAFSRLAWNAARLVDWVEKAATNTLLKPGDPFGHPLISTDQGRSINTYEDASTLSLWQPHYGQHGEVHFNCDDRGHTWRYAVEFVHAGQTIVKPRWGSWVTALKVKQKGTWVLLPQPPFVTPWGFPSTWGELRERFDAQGLRLDDIARKAILSGGEPLLMIGYPIPDTVDEPDARIQWQACKLPSLSSISKRTKGFRNVPDAWWLKARWQHLQDSRKLEWVNSLNHQPSELGSRGFLPEEVRGKSFVIIGAGALGSAIAEHLVRTGVTDIVLLDKDNIQTKNLVRHTLTLQDVPGNKAQLVAQRLSGVNTLTRPRGFDEFFPPTSEEARKAVEEADIIVDTTGSDDLLEVLGQHQWNEDKVLVVLSISCREKALYAHAETTKQFNAYAYPKAINPHISRDLIQMGGEPAPLEGIGCWDPVWPGMHTDIQLLASAGAKFIAEMATKRLSRLLRVFEQVEGDEGFAGLRIRPEEVA